MAIEPGPQFLYHGTHVEFEPGDIVNPVSFRHAFATTRPDLAEEHGPNVYQVEPVDPEEAKAYTDKFNSEVRIPLSEDRKATVKSQKGFRVIKRHDG